MSATTEVPALAPDHSGAVPAEPRTPITIDVRKLPDSVIADLVSVVPPGAQLAPTSKIPQSAVGKSPGHRLANSTFCGYDWRKHHTTGADIARWIADKASLGLKADRWPGLDIDVLDPTLASLIEEIAIRTLGPAPRRTGRAPKRLLAYKTSQPFSRMRLHISDKGTEHLIEVLGAGQQYLVAGIHPGTMRPYTWNEQPTFDRLTAITREGVERFFAAVVTALEPRGCVVKREGDGHTADRERDQASLVAPSMELLHEAVQLIPNTVASHPHRDDVVRMAAAIRAASGEEVEDGYNIFSAWCAKWDGGTNTPEFVRGLWDSLRPPFGLGYDFLAEQARAYGFNDAAEDFEALSPAPAHDDIGDDEATLYSDQWLADQVIKARRAEIRFVPAQGTYLVWEGARWKPDADLLAENIIDQELRKIARKVERHGATAAEKNRSAAQAREICSAGKASSVATVLRRNRAIAVPVEKLDADNWILNTPGGTVDLRTGVLAPANPDALCTKSTSVAPDFAASAGRWITFLDEATGGDRELQAYLQRLAGYSLTGSTREQHLSFLYGGGGNGKGTFMSTLVNIFGEYATVSTMDTFTASTQEKHSTDVAMLLGARLVVASETTAGKRWDDARVKSLTGGDRVTARFMRQDNITFTPQFKLVFAGNHKPKLHDIDAAMRRRMQMVPFKHTPRVVDPQLAEKLVSEYPAILAWAIQGCLDWQRAGLKPPPAVLQETAEYFNEHDPLFRFASAIVETGDVAPDGVVVDKHRLLTLFNTTGNQGKERVMVAALKAIFGACVKTDARTPLPDRQHIYRFESLARCRVRVAEHFGTTPDVDESVADWPTEFAPERREVDGAASATSTPEPTPTPEQPPPAESPMTDPEIIALSRRAAAKIGAPRVLKLSQDEFKAARPVAVPAAQRSAYAKRLADLTEGL